jgi:hypothetical protein
MRKIRDSYGNSKSSGFTIEFFEQSGIEARQAFLACPFYTTYEPIQLLTKRGCKVQLLVRLCSTTLPSALREALKDPNVTLRYFTSRDFHAKLYVVDNVALIGSANLTNAGLKSNREVSVVLRKERDSGFDDLPAMFNLLWDFGNVMTHELCDLYERAFRIIGRPSEEAEFQKILEGLVSPAEPPTAKVGSDRVSARRSFIQTLRRKYDEELIPAFREAEEVFLAQAQRRPEFAASDPVIELGRFLGWLRMARAPGETWKDASLVAAPERERRLSGYIREWSQLPSTTAGDMTNADDEIQAIGRLRSAFASPGKIEGLVYDQVFDALCGVHAFYDRLRFTSGGLSGLRTEFGQRNTLTKIKETLTYLLHGPGAGLERAYDCLYDEKRRLSGFGEACVMELLGWMDAQRPPINGRTIKALRFIGHNVRE